MELTIDKYHGLGNDYFVYDPNKNTLPLTCDNVRRLCDKNFGLGSDGIVEGPYFTERGIELTIWNPDGSLATQSGNGVRIFAKYLRDHGYITEEHFHLHTQSRDVEVLFLNEKGSRLRVSMGRYSFWSDDIPVTGERREVINEDMLFGRTLYPVTCVSVGNPHCIIPMREVSKPLVCKIGYHSEVARCFPDRINTQIMQVLDEKNVKIEIFERGAGYTVASGTGACAAAVAAHRLGLTGEEVTVHMPGGCLHVDIRGEEVYMTGDVFYVGQISLSQELIELLREAK